MIALRNAMAAFAIFALPLISASNAAQAQASIGSNQYGGVCFGAYCDPSPPQSVPSGVNAYGGSCIGAFCDRPNSQPSHYQPYPSNPYSMQNDTLYPSPFSPDNN